MAQGRPPGRRGLTWLWVGVLALIAARSPVYAQTVDWPFDDVYDSDLVYIHPLVNYALSPYWVRDWERNLASGSSVWGTVGSVSQKQFFTDVRVRVDEPLGDSRFRFLYSLSWLGGEHVDEEVLQQFLGFEMHLSGPLGAHALVHPTPDKGDLDAAFGLIVADSTRERFLRVSVRLDDLLYGDRNREGGVSEQDPIGVQWEGRYAWPAVEVFSQGHYGRGSRRVFPDETQTPMLAGGEHDRDHSRTRLRWVRTENTFLELDLLHYDFLTGEEWRESTQSFRYENRVVDLALRYAFPFAGGRWRAWPGLHVLDQESRAEGRMDERFRRTDVMPQVFVEYRFASADALEFGYMGSASDRLLESSDPERGIDRRAWSDKVKLGWTHHFSPQARLQLSLSHEVAPDRFGGGNVQFLAFF